MIAIEQGIKVVINARFLNKIYPIFPPYLYFDPMFNRYYSWFNSMLQFGSSKAIHILLVTLLAILILLFYQFIRKRYGTGALVNTMFAFLFSGAMCSLIDKIFWDGSLDYILIKGLFTFDLKDIYIDIFIVLLIVSVFSKNTVFKKMNDRNILKEFMKYLSKVLTNR